MSDQEPNIKRADYASKKGEIALRHHEYDGIQEYDQALPNWWLLIFFASLFFFFGYWIVYYDFGLIPSDEELIGKQLAAIEEAKGKELENLLANLNDETLVQQWAKDPEAIAAGQQAYMTYCIACHGADLHARVDLGGGQFAPLPGLSLKDGEWKYGDKPMDVFKIISEGSPPGSTGHNGALMVAWGQTLSPQMIAQMTAYIISENAEEFAKEP